MQLVAAHQRQLYQYVRMLMPCSQEVDDVLQETFLVMWRKFDESCLPGGFYVWACRIAYLEVLKARDRNIRQVSVLDQEILDQLAADEASHPEFFATSDVMLQMCLDKLPKGDRQLIGHRYELGMRVNAIAVELGRPVNSVSKSLARIRHVLRQCITDALESQVQEGSRAQ